MSERRRPVPAGWRLRPSARVRITGDGSTLMGGWPLRILTLSPRGGQLVAGWLAGEAVSDNPTERELARRLLDTGLADPDPPPQTRGDKADVTIVVPVYADPERLSACLAPLDHHLPVIVVDDGSPDPGAIATAAERYGAGCIRLPENRGASAARNAGLRTATTPFVAFLDADCVPPPGFPGDLLDHLADPAIALVAPRIVSGARDANRIARYERVRSALDMGPAPALVRPYARVWYVPSAAMVVRREALGAGFDEELHLGEDVDLVWRLHDRGWQVRYDPRITVAHEDRVRLGPWYRRRVAYNESVAPLLRRHPDRVPVLFLTPIAAFSWGAALGGSTLPLLALVAVRAVRRHRTARGRLPKAGGWATRAALDVTIREGLDLGRALAGPWAPLALVLGRPRLGRRRLVLLLATMIVRDWLADRPDLDPVSYAALRLADESSRGVGIWIGCLRARDFRALLPRRPPPPSRR